MTTTTHTPTPWYAHDNGYYHDIQTEQGEYQQSFVSCHNNPFIDASGEANAAHIVRCVNAHDAFVRALRTIAALSNAPTRHVDDYGDIARTALRDAGLEVAE